MKRNRIPALLLAMLLTLSLSVSAFAAGSTTATVPVTLTVDNQYRAVNVTVPSSLPVYVTNGTVITADNAKITNNSKTGAVRVKSVTISAAANWYLTKFGDKSLLAAEKVDSNKLGFALAIGGGKQVQTATNEQTQALITAPVDGCYMTGVGDLTGNTAKIDYAAIVTPLSNTMKNATVANVVFVIEWDTVA